MKYKVFAAATTAVICLLTLTACTTQRTVDAMKPNLTLTFTYEQGLRHEPSYAVWIEDETGYCTTVYVTGKAAESSWGGAERPYVLPIWSGIREKEVDVVAQATPKENAVIQFNIPDEFAGKKITLYLEANASFDFNDYYKEGLKAEQIGFNDVNGQPSMLWSAEIDPARQKVGETPLELAGAGDVLGNNHKVHDNLTNVTSAKKLLVNIIVKYDFVK